MTSNAHFKQLLRITIYFFYFALFHKGSTTYPISTHYLIFHAETFHNSILTFKQQNLTLQTACQSRYFLCDACSFRMSITLERLKRIRLRTFHQTPPHLLISRRENALHSACSAYSVNKSRP